MPNTIQAAAEGVPSPNRRSFIRNTAGAAVATIAAAPLAVGLAQAAETATVAELPVTRLNRLAWEVAHALDDWIADIGDGAGSWSAMIYPASFREWAVGFKNEEAGRSFDQTGSLQMKKVIDQHREAKAEFDRRCTETDAVALGREPSKAAWKRWRKADKAEDKALSEVCRFNAIARADKAAKASYLLDYESRNSLERRHVAAILYSGI